MFLTFISLNVKNVNLFGVFTEIDYFCGVKIYIKKRGHNTLFLYPEQESNLHSTIGMGF